MSAHRLDPLTEVRLSEEQIAGEINVARLALLGCALAACFSLATGLIVSRDLGLAFVPLAAGYAGYYVLLLWWLRRRPYPLWLQVLTTTLEASTATFVAMIDTHYVSVAYALTSSPTFLYFAAITLASLRLRRWLGLYAGAVASIETLLFYLWAYPRLPAELVATVPSFSPTIYLQRLGYLMLVGFIISHGIAVTRRLVASVAAEIREREHLRRVFGRYLTPAVADRLLTEGRAAGELREVTVLCSDVRGFTRYGADRPPEEVVAFLNALFERQCAIVARHGGWVDKFMGDGMMAVFGAPTELAGHALCACRAALEIAAIDAAMLPQGASQLGLGVAVHTGPAVVGSIGAEDRLEYTAIGDTVNTAFRIEGLNRTFGTRALVSEATRIAAGDGISVAARPVAPVRGHEEGLRTFELLGCTVPAPLP